MFTYLANKSDSDSEIINVLQVGYTSLSLSQAEETTGDPDVKEKDRQGEELHQSKFKMQDLKLPRNRITGRNQRVQVGCSNPVTVKSALNAVIRVLVVPDAAF